MDGDHLLQIGEFSRLTRTSVRMLRHYAEHGLLTPSQTDPETGYRYYRVTQLRDAERVLSLRDAGFTVAEMPIILASFDDPNTLVIRLEEQHRRLLIDQERLAERLASLDRLRQLIKEPTMPIDIRTQTVAAMTIAAVRDVIASYAHEQSLWDRLLPLIPPEASPPDALWGATYFDEDYQETDVDVEAWVQVSRPVSGPGLSFREVPEQRVLITTVYGSYDHINAVCRELGTYVAEHGLVTGAMFNLYRVSPAQDPNPDNWVTEVCLPIIGESVTP